MKTDTGLNVALIGCGRIASKHIEALNNLNDNGVKIVCAADIDRSRLDTAGLPSGTIKSEIFDDASFLKNVDLAVVLTESGNHYRHAKALLSHGLDILIEKPVTLRLDHAADLQRIANEQGNKVYVVKQNRFNHPIMRAKQFCDDGFLGKPQIGTIRVRWCRPQEYYDLASWRGTWLMDGGVISNQASHHIDLLRWFMGGIKSVSAIAKNFSAKIEAEDTIVAIVEFESGAVGTIEATTSTRPKNLEGSLSVQGDLGAFEVSGFAVNELRYLQSSHPNFELEKDLTSTANLSNTSDVYGLGHQAIYSEILADRLGKKNRAVLLEDAIASLELIHLIYLSVERNEKVFMNELGLGSARMGR